MNITLIVMSISFRLVAIVLIEILLICMGIRRMGLGAGKIQFWGLGFGVQGSPANPKLETAKGCAKEGFAKGLQFWGTGDKN